MDINEMIMKGKEANTVEELKEMAIKENWNISDEEANAYFDELQKYKTPNIGELSDDELDDVSGGGCHKDHRLVVTVLHKCWRFKCVCGSELPFSVRQRDMANGSCSFCNSGQRCSNCKYMTYEKGLWLCNNPANMK